MKTLLALLTVTSAVVFTNYNSGTALAEKENKPILVFFTADWCHNCKKMKAITFKNDNIIKQLEDYVCILVDVDKQLELKKKYKVRNLPTIILLSPTKQETARIVGYVNSNKLTRALNNVEEK